MTQTPEEGTDWRGPSSEGEKKATPSKSPLPPQVMPCPIYGKMYHGLKAYYKHRTNVHQGSNLKCEFCSTMFKTSGNKKKHEEKACHFINFPAEVKRKAYLQKSEPHVKERDSIDDLLGDSQEEEEVQFKEGTDQEAQEIQATSEDEGGEGLRATSGDGQRDAPSKEARKEEGPVKEKSDNKAGHGGRPGGQPDNPKEGAKQEDGPTDGDQSSALLKKELKEAIKIRLQDQKKPDAGVEPRPECSQGQGQSPARGAWTNPAGAGTSPE